MGKVVKQVANTILPMIAAAIAAVVVFSVLGLTGFAAVIAVAVLTAGLTYAGQKGLSAVGLGLRPSVPTTKGAYPQTTARIVRRRGYVGLPDLNLESVMRPVRDSWLANFRRWGLGRFHVLHFDGNCLYPVLTDRWGIVDLEADIRAGDLFEFDTHDRLEAWPQYGNGKFGLSKRFVGVNRELGVLEFETTTPPATFHTGLSNLKRAHRVRATAASENEAWQLLRRVRRNPEAFDERLAGPRVA